jgi:hypothetical protein
MRLYLSGSWPRRDELKGYLKTLEADGHLVTSRWLKERHSGDSVKEDTARRYCAEDLEDINRASVLVLFVGDRGSRGGKWYEAGYASHARKKIYVVGIPTPEESIFHLLADAHFEDFDAFLAHVSGGRKV